MSLVKGEHNGYEIIGSVYTDGSIGWRCEALERRNPRWNGDLDEFPDYRELVKAIDAYDLASRKDYVNKTAYVIRRAYGNNDNKWEAVEVTSITPNGDEAWIRSSEGRRKVTLKTLYATKDAVETYVNSLNALMVKYDADEDKLDAELDAARWVPIRK